MNKTIVVIGGGAGGMTTAAQLKKLSPATRVVVFERSAYVSWAGCPTPYYIAEKLPFDSVVHFSPNFFRERGIEIYTKHEVKKINFEQNKLIINGEEISGEFEYDELVLSLGGKPIVPPFKGIEEKAEGLFKLSHANDAVEIKEYIDNKKPKRAVIIGGGFIGIEMAESFTLRGVKTTVVEMQDKIFPNTSKRIREAIYNKMEEKNINLLLNKEVSEILSSNGKVKGVKFKDGETLKADIILMAIGIKPNTDLLKNSNFNFDENGRVAVNEYLKTSYDNVYALGDLIFNKNQITGEQVYAPFGDVADKQGIILSKTLSKTRRTKWKGVIGTSAFSFFDLKIARTGLTLEQALERGYTAKSVRVNGLARVSGFEDTKPGEMDIVYDSDMNKILGAAMIGSEAIAQFIDQIAIAITFKISIEDFFDIDFAYSPTNSTVWNPMLAAYRRIIK
jgi:NADPH-dependent 2,4-dienoyl-CoA reductase/sulfur reductase-like enzyme